MCTCMRVLIVRFDQLKMKLVHLMHCSGIVNTVHSKGSNVYSSTGLYQYGCYLWTYIAYLYMYTCI